MDGFTKELLDFAYWLLIAPLLWFLKRITGRLDKVEKELSEHKIEIAKTYIPKEELLDSFKQMNIKLDKLVDHLIKEKGG